ncbi:SIMPL domain-containing protein [Streptomyces bobili]|uniref:SIMPL domain-containing protein n=1 Tax=Streptomyces bobili TaxID=67280 RepID=UPI0033FEF41A
MATPAAHGTPDVPLLVVRGESAFEADPDLARLGIGVTARGRDRRTTLDDLTRRNTEVLELVRSYGEAVTDVSTGAVSLTPELTEHGRGERVRSHRGRVHITAELTDFTALGELTTRLADLGLTQIDGPWWELRPDSPAHREVRQRAVRDAVRRAHEYAEALGTSVAALVELADLGTESMAGRPRSGFGRRAMRMSAAATEDAPPEPLDLEPQRIRLRAEVKAQFTMVPPHL